MDVVSHYAQFLKIFICGVIVGTAVHFRLKPIARHKTVQVMGRTMRLSTVYGLALIAALGFAFEVVGRTFNLFTGELLLSQPLVIASYTLAVFILSSRP
ncbi:hypothetical protein [Marinicella sp. W31]|uniref:hypothetical protein n=1 Tax=Marinicella sp. W31 TaxID=3023713 RepID=UPI003756B43B